MSKYVIDIPDDVVALIGVSASKDDNVNVYTQYVSDLNTLTPEYVKEHFSELFDPYDRTYENGLEDAWECAKKICLCKEDGGISNGELLEIFKVGSDYTALKKYTASEAIAKLKAYEQRKQEEAKIKVGDEVIGLSSDARGTAFVTKVAEESNCVFYTYADGYNSWDYPSNLKKTGRHFDITSIFEKMKENNNE